AGRALQVFGRRHRSRVVTRYDARDPLGGQTARQPLRLDEAAGRERDVGVLDDPERVALGLPVADQEQAAHRDGSQTVARTAGSAASTSRKHARTRAMLASDFAGISPRETWAMNSSRPVAIRSDALTSSCSACTRRIPGRP